FESANEAVTLSIGLISVLVFWLGMMNIAKHDGVLDQFATLFNPFVHRLFTDIPKGHPAIGYILSNVSANLVGIGTATTPMGLKAMEELKRLEASPGASRSMITFLALNTSSVTLIPTKVIAIRMQYGSVSPTEIVGTSILATLISTICAISLDRLFHHISK